MKERGLVEEPKVESIRVTLLLFTTLYFYFTVLSQILFLFGSRFFNFQTLRERAGFGGHMRNKIDFLYFV